MPLNGAKRHPQCMADLLLSTEQLAFPKAEDWAEYQPKEILPFC